MVQCISCTRSMKKENNKNNVYPNKNKKAKTHARESSENKMHASCVQWESPMHAHSNSQQYTSDHRGDPVTLWYTDLSRLAPHRFSRMRFPSQGILTATKLAVISCRHRLLPTCHATPPSHTELPLHRIALHH